MDFSVITTSYNDTNGIEKYIEQIEKQTVKPLELIVVDGGSKDDTIQKILSKSESISDFKIRVISDRGRLNIAQGFNIGIKECLTEFMVIGGIGNEYDKYFFEEFIKYQQKSNYEVVYGPVFGINTTNFARSFNIAFVGGDRGWDFGQASNHGVLIKKSVFEKCGYFWENFIYAGEDTEFYRRINSYKINTGYCEKAKLYWETPTSWTEYFKKMKVNAIADMQEQPIKKIFINIISRILIVISGLLLNILIHPTGFLICLILLIMFFILSTYRIRSMNFMALLLRLHFFFLPAYYYIKNFPAISSRRIV